MNTFVRKHGVSEISNRTSTSTAGAAAPLPAHAAQRLAMVYQLILARAAEAEAPWVQMTGHAAPVAPHPLAETSMFSLDKARELPQPVVSSV